VPSSEEESGDYPTGATHADREGPNTSKKTKTSGQGTSAMSLRRVMLQGLQQGAVSGAAQEQVRHNSAVQQASTVRPLKCSRPGKSSSSSARCARGHLAKATGPDQCARCSLPSPKDGMDCWRPRHRKLDQPEARNQDDGQKLEILYRIEGSRWRKASQASSVPRASNLSFSSSAGDGSALGGEDCCICSGLLMHGKTKTPTGRRRILRLSRKASLSGGRGSNVL
jgi:hypothetical protein